MDDHRLGLALRAAPGAPDSLGASPDTTKRGRVVREFPALEVRALLPDLESSQTVHMTSAATMRSLPVDGVADVVALQPGVVVQGDELHVRGGRAGELAVTVDGLTLNEPLRGRFMEVPLFALRSADLVSGTPEVQYATGLAGVLDLRTANPGRRLASEWRWESDGRLGTHYDRVAGRMDVPLRIFGLGLVTAGDATLDDTWLPALHSNGRTRVGGTSWGWRADNRLLGFVKLAPIAGDVRSELKTVDVGVTAGLGLGWGAGPLSVGLESRFGTSFSDLWHPERTAESINQGVAITAWASR